MFKAYSVFISEARREGAYLVSCPELFNDWLEIDPEKQSIFEAIELVLIANLEIENFSLVFFGETYSLAI